MRIVRFVTGSGTVSAVKDEKFATKREALAAIARSGGKQTGRVDNIMIVQLPTGRK